jgi:hypothetical protein
MMRSTALLTAMLIAILTGCRAVAPASQPAASATPASASPSPSPSPSLGTPTPAPSQCFLGGGIADVHYSTLPEFGVNADGIANTEVVAVGPLSYSTENGERPSCEYIAAAQSVFSVGRMIQLAVKDTVAGSAEVGRIVRYWLPGGDLGSDVSRGHHFGLQAPTVGDRMLAFFIDRPVDIDGGAGVLEVDAYELFAIGDDGRIITPNANEHVTTDNVAALLRGVLPSD